MDDTERDWKQGTVMVNLVLCSGSFVESAGQGLRLADTASKVGLFSRTTAAIAWNTAAAISQAWKRQKLRGTQ
jgi:hypothetical protein